MDGRRQGARPGDPLRFDDIVATATRVIEERGAERFSIRALAAELDVFPTAVYWHVGSRGQLLAAVGAAWMADVVPSDASLPWDEWLLQMGRRYRAAALRSPNVARLIASELVNDPAGFELPEAVVGHLERVDYPPEELVHAYNAMIGATVGFVDLELARDASRTELERERVERSVRGLDAERYPSLGRHVDRLADRAFSLRWTEATEAPLDDSFEYLMAIIVDGLRRRLPGT